MTTGQQIALQPALADVLGQDLHDPPVGRQVIVARERLRIPGAVGHLEHCAQAVGGGLVRAHDPEAVGIASDHLAQEPPEQARGLARAHTRPVNLDGVGAKVWHLQVAQQQTAVGVRVGAHAPLPLRGQRRQLRAQRAALVEQLLGPIRAQPRLQLRQVLGLCVQIGERNLVGAERPLRRQPVDLLGTGPALRCAQHDHRPARPTGGVGGVGVCVLARPAVPPLRSRQSLNLGDLPSDLVQRCGHLLVHRRGIRALHEPRRVAVAFHQRAQLVLGNPREHGRVGDLVAVEMQHRQHRSVADRVQELVRVPARGQRAGLRLAVADDAADQQVRVVEHSAVGVQQRVPQLSPLVDRARRLGSDVAGDAAGKRELAQQPAQPLLVVADVGVDFGVRPLQIRVGHDPRPAVAGAGDVDHVQIARSDHPVQVRVEEVETRRRAPMPQQARLYVLDAQRLAQQWIGEQVDLPDRQVVGGAPVGVQRAQLLRREGAG